MTNKIFYENLNKSMLQYLDPSQSCVKNIRFEKNNLFFNFILRNRLRFSHKIILFEKIIRFP